MVASAIATALKGYSRFFDVDKNAYYVYPVKQNITVDGYAGDDEDWYRLRQQFTAYENSKLSLLLVDDEDYLYFYLKVKDDNIVYRNPRYIPLDSSDHLRIDYIDIDKQHHRLVVTTEAQGTVSVYRVKQDWQS